jgi:hypothetical protein
VLSVQYPINTFLGSYIPPEQLTLQNVRATAAPETFESAIATAQLLAPGVLAAVRDTAQNLQPGQQLSVGAWSQTVSAVKVAGGEHTVLVCCWLAGEMQAGTTVAMG